MSSIENSVRNLYNSLDNEIQKNIVQPFEKMVIRELHLTRSQLNLVYAILKAIPVALVMVFAPTWIVVGASLALVAVDMISPNSLSAKNWTAIHFGMGGSAGLQSVGFLIAAVRTSSVGFAFLAIYELAVATLSVLRGMDAFKKVPNPLDDEEVFVQARVDRYSYQQAAPARPSGYVGAEKSM